METTEAKRTGRSSSVGLSWGPDNNREFETGNEFGEVANPRMSDDTTKRANVGGKKMVLNPSTEDRPSIRQFAKCLLLNDQPCVEDLPRLDSKATETPDNVVNQIIFPFNDTHMIKSRIGNTIYRMLESKVAEEFDQMSLTKRQHSLLQQQPQQPLQTNANIINSSCRLNQSVLGGLPSRVVALTNIHFKLSLSTLLSQICGGPLERIELQRRDRFQQDLPSLAYNLLETSETPTNWTNIDVLLYFHKPEDALEFYEYSKTGMFLVNGQHIDTYWVTYEEVIGDETNILEKMNVRNEKARRVLVFKKPVLNKRHRTAYERRHWPDPCSHFTKDFDYQQAVRDFGQYGGLVEVMPVISRKTCFGVQFMDVRTAMRVKQIVQDRCGDAPSEWSKLDTSLQAKYKDWYVWYGADPCEKASIV